MNKGIIIASIVIIIILIVGAGLFLMSSDQNLYTETSSSEYADQTQISNAGTLKNLLASAVPQQCTFEDTSDASANSQGTVYVAQQKMRGDFTTTTNGQIESAHIVVDAEKTYIWIDGQTQGFVASLSASDEYPTSDTSKSVDLDKQVKYSCSPWVPDTSKFERPSTVQFTDFTTLSTGAAPGATDTTKDVQCAACASAPAESQAQCLAALGCN